MYVSSADMFTILQKEILKMKFLQELHLKIYLTIGFALLAESVKNILKRKSKFIIFAGGWAVLNIPALLL